MHLFKVPVLSKALEENDVETLSKMLHELNAVVFTLRIKDDKNILQLVLAHDYKYPPVRHLVLQVLELTRPDAFKELIGCTTMADVTRLEDPTLAEKYLNNSANFGFNSCRVHLPVDATAVSKAKRSQFYADIEGNAQLNAGFEPNHLLASSKIGNIIFLSPNLRSCNAAFTSDIQYTPVHL